MGSIKRRGVRTVIITLLMMTMMVPITAHGADPERWGNYDVRTVPNSNLTADLLNEVFDKYGQGGVLLGLGGAIMDAGEKNGINPGILAGFIIHETGWGRSNYAINNNNLGGVKCRKGFECRNGFTVFDSPVHSIQVQAELLAGSTYVGDGLITLKQILERYAPPSDGNTLYGSGGYIAVVGSLMEKRFLQSVDGGEILTATGGSYNSFTGSSGYVEGASVGSWRKHDFFMQSQSLYNGVGLDSSDNVLPSELSYELKIFSEQTYEWLMKLGAFLTAVIITYMALTILMYVTIIKGVSQKTGVFEKLTGIKGDVYSRETLWHLVWRMFVGIMIASLFLTGLYIEIMGLIYKTIAVIVDFLF